MDFIHGAYVKVFRLSLIPATEGKVSAAKE